MAEATTARNAYTRRTAEFVSQLRYEHVSAEVRDRLKLLILDSLGCAIYGANLKWCRIIRETLERVDKTRTTGIWAPTGSFRRSMRRWSTARRCRVLSSMTCIARGFCMSAQ